MHAISGELEYLERLCLFLQTLGPNESDLDRLWPDLHPLSAVNFLFWLSVESGPAAKAMVWYTAGRVFADSCRAMREGLARHQFGDVSYALHTALKQDDAPVHVHSKVIRQPRKVQAILLTTLLQ